MAGFLRKVLKSVWEEDKGVNLDLLDLDMIRTEIKVEKAELEVKYKEYVLKILEITWYAHL